MRILLFTAAIYLIFFASCSDKNYPKVGELCEISEECFAAISKDKLNELTRYSVKNQYEDIKYMIASGEVTTLMPEYGFVLIKADFPSYKLEVTDLYGEVSEWWISSQFLKEKQL